jgi:hypothetical protein
VERRLFARQQARKIEPFIRHRFTPLDIIFTIFFFKPDE